MQLVGIAMVSTILCIVIKKDRPEMANFVALTAGIIILLSVVLKYAIAVALIGYFASNSFFLLLFSLYI